MSMQKLKNRQQGLKYTDVCLMLKILNNEAWEIRVWFLFYCTGATCLRHPGGCYSFDLLLFSTRHNEGETRLTLHPIISSWVRLKTSSLSLSHPDLWVIDWAGQGDLNWDGKAFSWTEAEWTLLTCSAK